MLMNNRKKREGAKRASFKKNLAVLLAFSMVFSMVPGKAMPVSAATGKVDSGETGLLGDTNLDAGATTADAVTTSSVTYVSASWDSDNKKVVTSEESVSDYEEMPTGSAVLTEGTYVVEEDVEVSTITVTGEVKLILCDGVTLSTEAVNTSDGDSNVLSIYGQEEGTGTLKITTVQPTAMNQRGNDAMIGNFIVYGGIIKATASNSTQGYGITSWANGNSAERGGYGLSGNVTVYNGYLTATGGDGGRGGYGHRPGSGGAGGDGINGSATIYGGKVTATGGDGGNGGGNKTNKPTVLGNKGNAGNGIIGAVTIYGGKIKATAGVIGSEGNDNTGTAGENINATTSKITGGEYANTFNFDLLPEGYAFYVDGEDPDYPYYFGEYECQLTYEAGTGDATNTITALCKDESVVCKYTEGFTITLNVPKDAAYDGKAKTANITGYPEGDYDLLEEEPTEIKYYSTVTSGDSVELVEMDSAPVEPGDYYAEITWGGTTIQVPYTIGKGDLAVSTVVTSETGFVYTATPVALSVSNNPDNSEVAYYVNTTDSNENGTLWTDAYARSLDAGIYYVYAVIEESEHYKEYTSGTTAITVNKAEATFEKDELTDDMKPTAVEGLVYTGEEKELIVKPEDYPEYYSAVYSVNDGKTWEDTVFGTNAGTYTVKVKYESENYADVYGDDIEVIIDKAVNENVINVNELTITNSLNDRSNDGSIALNDYAGVEYSGDEGTTWNYVGDESGLTIEGLQVGDYLLRFAETDNYYASVATTASVGNQSEIDEPYYEDYKNEVIAKYQVIIDTSIDSNAVSVAAAGVEKVENRDYDDTMTLDKNKAALDEIYEDSILAITNDFKAIKEKYLTVIASFAYGGDSEEVTEIINNAKDEVENYEYNNGITYDENLDALNDLVNDIINEAYSQIAAIRDELVKNYNLEKAEKLKYFTDETEKDNSDEVIELANAGISALDALEYDYELSYDENIQILNDTYSPLQQKVRSRISSESYEIISVGRSLSEATEKVLTENADSADYIKEYISDVEYAIENYTVDSSLTPKENKAKLQSMYDDMVKNVDYMNQFENRKELLDSILEEIDTESDVVSDLVYDGRKEISELEYDTTLTFDENYAKLAELYSKVNSEINEYIDNIAKFEDEKEDALVILENLKDGIEDEKILAVIDDGKTAITEIEYGYSDTFEDNIETVIDKLGEITSLVTNYKVFEIKKVSYITDAENLRLKGDDDTITEIIDELIEDIQALEYDEDISLEHNYKNIDNLYSEAKTLVKNLRNERIEFFETQRLLIKAMIQNYERDDDSDTSKQYIAEALAGIESLEYDTNMTYEENLYEAKSYYNNAKFMVDTERSNEAAEAEAAAKAAEEEAAKAAEEEARIASEAAAKAAEEEAEKAAKEKDAADTEAADEVKVLISDLPSVDSITVDDEAAVTEAREAYEALTEDQKAKVGEDALERLNATENALNEAIQTDINDTQVAEDFMETVSNLPEDDEITTADKEAIEAARKAYEELTDSQKAKVKNSTLNILKDAEDVLAEKVAEEEAAKAAEEEAAAKAAEEEAAKKAAEEEAAKKAAEEAAAASKAAAELAAATTNAADAMNSQVKITQTTKKITVKWTKATKADGYYVYVQYAGSKAKLVKTITKNTTVKLTLKKLNGKKINLKKNIFVYVAAYKTINGKKTTLAKSNTYYVAGKKSKKYTNVKKLTVNKTSASLSVGKTLKLSAKVTLVNKKKKHLPKSYAAKFRYKTSDESVAKVSSSGQITAVGKGSCTIYVYAINGLTKKVNVTVK